MYLKDQLGRDLDTVASTRIFFFIHSKNKELQLVEFIFILLSPSFTVSLIQALKLFGSNV